MKTEHKYAQVLRWIADGEDVLGSLDGGGEGEFPHDFSPFSVKKVLLGDPGWEFRLKPRTITVNGREIAAGEREALQPDESYCVADPTACEYFVSYCWSAHPVNLAHLARGLVHLTEENAIAHAKAMLGID